MLRNPWVLFGLGVLTGAIVAPKLRALTGGRLPQYG